MRGPWKGDKLSGRGDGAAPARLPALLVKQPHHTRHTAEDRVATVTAFQVTGREMN